MAYTSGSSSGSSTGSVGSSGGCRGSCGGSCVGGCGGSLVRTVRLARRPPPAKLGFSLRGGREHGTGFFVTAVEPSSEAYHNGLMVGDQILRVNSFPVDDATHKEVLQLIQGQSIITLKVKAVGMIPVKENPEDELSWHIVDMVPPRCHGDLGLKQDICDDLRTPTDVRMVLRVPPRAKLGCGICKGPEWKPGVFVQFTKENGIARLAGLRPGDQILQCNNFIFTPDTPFNEAVAVMRCSGVLELIVRKGAGMELFPGESSGYNSSASSVAGDPPRLSALQEETPINGNINGLPTNGSSEHHHHNRTVNSTSNRPEYPNGCTVIHVGGADDVDATNEANHLNNNNNNNKKQIAEICMVSQQLETKTTTVFVEVHHSEDDNVSHAQSDASTDRMTNSSSVSSFTSSASSLSSAISQELERRSKQRPPFVDPRERDKDKKPSEKLIKSGLAKEKVQQHEQLMEEFKKAHRKMFAGEQHNGSEHNVKEEREESRLSSSVAKTNDTVDSPRMDVKSEPKTKRQTAPPPPPPFPRALEAPGEEQFRVPPPPKPPSSKKYPAPTPPSQPPPPPSPPHCPTPDYDTASLASEALDNNRYNNYQAVNNNKPAVRNGLRRNDGRTDKVEMQSLESFKLTNPSKVKPRPPPTYFTPTSSTHSEISNGSTASTLPAKDRPVVTIREYPDGRDRKNPTKFDFLQNGQAAGQFDDTEPIACRLQNELSQTLSRAAVLNRDESQCASNGAPKGTIVTINVNHSQLAQKSEQAKPFYLFHGQNGVQNGTNGSQAQKISTMIHSAAQKTKSKTAPMEKNSVTFNFNQKAHEIRNGVNSAPNGILKNTNVSHVQIQSQIDKMAQQKSIKFGGI